MTQQLFSLVRKCSHRSRSNLCSFVAELMSPAFDKETTRKESQNEASMQKIFASLSMTLPISKVRQLSRSERREKSLTNQQYNYGEVTFKTIRMIMERVNSHRTLGDNEIFYDLGSGSGKLLIAASLCFSFQQCKGVEYLQSLYEASANMVKEVLHQRDFIQRQMKQLMKEDYKLPLISVFNSDLKNHDWSDGTVIFVTSTCYSRQLMQQISVLSQNLCEKAVLITLSRQAEVSPFWRLVEKLQGETSWGLCTIYIHLRKDFD